MKRAFEQKGKGKLAANIPGILFVIVFLSVGDLADAAEKATGKAGTKGDSTSRLPKTSRDLISATNQYKASIEALVPMYEESLKQALDAYEKRKELHAHGIISRVDLEAGEQAIKQAQAQLDQARKQITESEHLIAEVSTPPAPVASAARYKETSAIMRSSGSSGWSLAEASKVQGFFASQFGRALPVSAFGQTATHDRMRFDHRNSLDVALHPDSAEGRALIAYLRSSGIPFIAFRSAVPGAATGAHIHIGRPSHRI